MSDRLQNGMSRRAIARPASMQGRLVAAVALATTSLATANVTVNQWNSSTSFHHKRIGVPDQDQKRVGLPNAGACYCAPTSYVNMMIYIANYGYPQVEPGPGVYSDYTNYYNVTDLLEELGAQASISPGGDDPNDPDCNGDSEGGGGGDGECGSLPCGGKVTNVHNAFVGNGYYGAAIDDLVFIAKSLDQNAPATNFTTFGQLAIDGAIIELCYGRYAPVGTFSGATIYKRGGGHCVTMNGIDREASDMSISVRDPAQDEEPDDVFGPSPYVTKVWDITNVSIFVTDQDPDDGPITTFSIKSLPAIDEPQADGKKRLVDGYFAIKPKTGTFWKDLDIIQDLPLSIGFGGIPPFPHPAPLAPILDLVSDEHDLGWFVLTAGNRVQPSQLLKMNPISKETQVLAATNAKQLALSRFDEIYTISESPAQIERRDAAGNLLGSAPIAGLPKAIACDDTLDLTYVIIPGTSGFGGSIVGCPRALSVPGAPLKTWLIPSSVQLGLPGSAPCRATVNPDDGRLWIACEATDKALAFSLPFVPAGPVMPVDSLGGFDALTGVEFDDGGTMYAVDNGKVEAYERDSAGQWQPADAGAFDGVEVGPVVRIAKSRSNFDPAVHDTPAWDNIDADDLEPLGVDVPDCLGDLTGDGSVGAEDLAVLLGQWGAAGTADLDQSGVVEAGDLARLLGAWGNCQQG